MYESIVLGYVLGKWTERTIDLKTALKLNPEPRTCRVIFASLRNFITSPELQQTLTHKYGFPPYLFSPACSQSNGFAGFLPSAPDVVPPTYVTWSRFLIKQVTASHALSTTYDWSQMTFLTHQEETAMCVLCLDVPSQFRGSLLQELQQCTIDPLYPNFHRIQVLLLHKVVTMYDRSVWAIRDVVRALELQRNVISNDVDFARLHDTLRHAIHVTETLDVAVGTISTLLGEWRSLEQRGGISPNGASWSPITSEADFLLCLMKSFCRRSESNQLRLQNEINLALHLVAQRDSKATIQISDAAQRNSAAMKTISIVTLAFLPATFVSTLFSMSFFDYSLDPESSRRQWVVSDRIWIYWVIVAPLTVMMLLLWRYGQYLSLESLHSGLERTGLTK